MTTKKSISVLVLAAALLFSPVLALPASAAGIRGVSAWAETEIAEADALGFIPSSLSKNMQAGITRREFTEAAVWFLAAQFRVDVDRVCDIPRETDPDTGLPVRFFKDVDDVYVNAAYYYGIISGRGNGRFDPSSLITREEAAKILLNTYLAYAEDTRDIASVALKDRYADAYSISSWASEAVSAMSAWGVMRGVTDSTFSPKGTYTREQCFVTFLRLWNYAPCSRQRDNVLSPVTFDSALAEIRASEGYEELWYGENGNYAAVFWKEGAGRAADTRFSVVYRDGGMRDVFDGFPKPFDYPDSVPGGFQWSEDGESITFAYHPTVGIYDVYRIDLAAGTVGKGE